jgi:hypothetical protein
MKSEITNPTKKQKILKAVKAAFLVLVFFFLVKYFVDNRDTIKQLDIKPAWGVFAGSMLLYFAYKLTLASLWHYITKTAGAGIGYADAVTAYLYSILGKYIPGKVFMLAARIPAYERNGVPVRKVAVCFLLENVCTLLGAGFLFLISLLFFPNELLSDYGPAVILLIILFFICIHPKIINFFLKLIGKLIKKQDMELPFKYTDMLKIVTLFIGNWLIVGTGFYLLVSSIYPLAFNQLLYVGGVYGLSAIIGIISIFAPSGIGVREGVMILGLGLIMPNEYAVIIGVVSRLWATVAELILVLGGFSAEKIRKRKIHPADHN